MREPFLPEWNTQGLLPAVFSGEAGLRSPYAISLLQLVERFGTSRQRLVILRGLLEYRKQLHVLGLVDGMQWLNGSFVENIEALQDRPPNDVDVVTFAFIPMGESQSSLYEKNQSLFRPADNKQKYKVDSYYMFLGVHASKSYIDQVTYWYGLWSHTRSGQWKGFVQLDLGADEDDSSFKLIASLLEGVDE